LDEQCLQVEIGCHIMKGDAFHPIETSEGNEVYPERGRMMCVYVVGGAQVVEGTALVEEFAEYNASGVDFVVLVIDNDIEEIKAVVD